MTHRHRCGPRRGGRGLPAPEARPAHGANRARARRRRVCLLGLHPLEDAAASTGGALRGEAHGGNRRARAEGARGRRVPRLHDPPPRRHKGGRGLSRRGIDVHKSEARITGPGRVEVDGGTLEAERVVLATGSDTSVPQIPGLAEAGFWTNREATTLNELPESVVVLG